MSELFVPMYPNGDFAEGGGSSTPPSIRAFDNPESAMRSAARLPTRERVYDQANRLYRWESLGTPKPRRFISEDVIDAVKIKVNNALVMYAVEPALYREIMAAIDDVVQ